MKDRRAPVALLTVALVGVGLALARARRGPAGNRSVPEPCKPVSLDDYLGLWYEIGRYENAFERGLEGVTAEYRARPDGAIQIINTGCRGGPSGRVNTARGVARVVDGSHNTKLKVSFFGPFFFGDYWVLDHADDYAWSIVGEPSGRYLWLLCRAPNPSTETRDTMQARARELGYDTGLIHTTLH
ncbi:MAG TPA: lipocalin family protein [Caulobacteraceae bacterium]|nr:lipocalin family protein [Caulobacteraceae bacterium]